MMLELRDIGFAYKSPVLRGISFDLRPGQLVAVLGPNGAGKSTLVKIIVGILDPASGAVSLDGQALARMSHRNRARMIGYVPQDSSLRFPLTTMHFVLQGRFAQAGLIGFESDADVEAAEWAMCVTETDAFAARLV